MKKSKKLFGKELKKEIPDFILKAMDHIEEKGNNILNKIK